MSEELKPCPFCGETPDLPSGDGTYYVIECRECGGAVVGIQISDLMTIEERQSDPFTDYRYAEQFIERAKAKAAERWNTRATPPAAQVQEYFPSDLLVSSVMNADEVDPANFAAQVQGEREAFEAWYIATVVAKHGEFSEEGVRTSVAHYRAVDDTYSTHDGMKHMWEAWQARAALSAPPAAGVPAMGTRPQTCNGKRCGWCKEGAEPCHYTPSAAGAPDARSFQAAFLTKRVWDLAAELEALKEQKPVAWGVPNTRITESHPFVELLHSTEGCQYPDMLAPLYAAPTPPASEQQQAVVMPEPMHVVYGEGDEGRRKEGWNDYRGELLRLNPHLAGVNQGVTTEAGNGEVSDAGE